MKVINHLKCIKSFFQCQILSKWFIVTTLNFAHHHSLIDVWYKLAPPARCYHVSCIQQIWSGSLHCQHNICTLCRIDVLLLNIHWFISHSTQLKGRYTNNSIGVTAAHSTTVKRRFFIIFWLNDILALPFNFNLSIQAWVMLKLVLRTILVVGVVLAIGQRGRRQQRGIRDAKNMQKGDPSRVRGGTNHGTCGGCSFPWQDWNNVTHYGCTNFDGDAHWWIQKI